MDKRLTLSQNDKMISGVCGGIGEYFKIDPTVIRIIFILLSFIFVGSPIPIYIIFWIIIPSNKNNKTICNKKYKEGFYDFSEFDDKK